MLASLHLDNVATSEIPVWLTVDAVDAALPLGDLDLDQRAGRQHDAVGGRKVRRDRGDQQLARLRMQDRAADAERVRRAAGRGRDNDAIRAIVADRRVVGPHGHLHGASDRASPDDDVVQRVEAVSHFLARADHLRLDHGARLDAARAPDDLLEPRHERFERDLGQEPDSPEVHAEEGDRMRDDRARGAQHRAIAATRQQHVGPGDVLRDGLLVPRGRQPDFGHDCAEARVEVARASPRQLRLGMIGDSDLLHAPALCQLLRRCNTIARVVRLTESGRAARRSRRSAPIRARASGVRRRVRSTATDRA